MVKPTLDEVHVIQDEQKYQRIPLRMELYADTITPIIALKKLKNISKHCFMLESAEDSKQWGRYTFIGYDPILELTCIDGMVQMKTEAMVQKVESNPAEIIRKVMRENLAPVIEGHPPFTGGFVGYFSYDYIKYAEPSLKLDALDEEGFKDVDLMLFDKLIVFDNYKQKIYLIVNIRTEAVDRNYQKGLLMLQQMATILTSGEVAQTTKFQLKSEIKQLFDKKSYCEMVNRAKQYIYEGDIFQVVLSNRMEAEIEGSLIDVYRVLRTLNPSPYMFYFSSDDVEIAGASPETLVKLEDKRLYTFPLAGTRPRGRTEKEDQQLEYDLLHDEKEIAEHNMLVDLGRNDIGRISKFGSVEVTKHMSIERFSHVMHIGSTVTGEIHDSKDALDAIDSILPAGTLSGAPKLRACEIINELENNKRGIYGGAVGYIDFGRNLDTCIAIRLAFAKNGKVFVRSGAGIVADSVPENEYQECINKAKAMTVSLRMAEGGIDI